jgi:hypothetical protein
MLENGNPEVGAEDGRGRHEHIATWYLLVLLEAKQGLTPTYIGRSYVHK